MHIILIAVQIRHLCESAIASQQGSPNQIKTLNCKGFRLWIHPSSISLKLKCWRSQRPNRRQLTLAIAIASVKGRANSCKVFPYNYNYKDCIVLCVPLQVVALKTEVLLSQTSQALLVSQAIASLSRQQAFVTVAPCANAASAVIRLWLLLGHGCQDWILHYS